MSGKLSRSLQEYGPPGEEANKDVLLPLTEGVLLNNLGIPLAVVCTKVDTMATLEKDLDYTDAHFDLIQVGYSSNSPNSGFEEGLISFLFLFLFTI